MKISVGITSTPISDLLTQAQKSAILERKEGSEFTFIITQVTTGPLVYLEGSRLTATLTDGFPLTGRDISVSETNFLDLNIISDTADTEVRILSI